ncbi:MAG: hypothetical protein HY862_12685 [Chloroflexi bacterium]|nr:hypothetical protein [Chloroflexota bacterium]
MTMTNETVYVPTDEDILESLHTLVRSHDQVRLSRSYFTYTVVSGVVKLVGNVKTPIVRRAFKDGVLQLAGVSAVDDTELYDDETILWAVGKVLPFGIRARLNHGAVALSGALPAGASAEEIVANVGEIPGVRLVTFN